MGIFKRYIKKDKDGNPILGKKGRSKKEGPWFIQYPYARDPQTGRIKYRAEKASFSKKKADEIKKYMDQKNLLDRLSEFDIRTTEPDSPFEYS